ncbi:ferredoxin [Nonomuraea endophytica]|uniref:Ferredoxin n=1 Tax=Nonomuraea endophytica TaxID=714136 RepID=A0A7W8EG25_9ACTN|nr:ferredoxin [Nonomuraea endophytica]MBB5078038.1 ferredoxin [Nonomuraea endophytica]
MVIVVDRERCAAAGQCAAWAPEVFDQDPDDGRIVLLAQSDGPQVRRAVSGCPTGAITLMPSSR